MPTDDHPELRASDIEREHTIDVLRNAAGEGRLTFEELADRIELAAGSQTLVELDELMHDLPQVAPAAAPEHHAGGELARPAQRSSVFGDVRRSGSWAVPAVSSWRTCFGDVVLDLRDASVTDVVVTIGANTVFGDIELLVPEGVIVDVRSRTFFGSVIQEAGDVAPAGASRVVLVGGTIFGDVRVRAQRLRERLADRLLGRP